MENDIYGEFEDRYSGYDKYRPKEKKMMSTEKDKSVENEACREKKNQ